MGTTSQKLTYLNDTKQGLKTVINYTGANIINTTTFREYVEKLYSGYIDILNNPKTLFNNMPHITGTGTSLTLNDTAECKMAIELEPSELSQITTTGKNFLPTNKDSYQVNGLTVTKNEDGTYTLKGTSTDSAFVELFDNTGTYTIPAGTYISSTNIKANIYMRYNSDYFQEISSTSTQTETFTFSESKIFNRVYLYVPNANVTYNDIIKPMVRLSSVSDDTFEKYTGNQPAPNPNYPQDVHVITGDNTIKIENKNIMDTNTLFNEMYSINNATTEETIDNRKCISFYNHHFSGKNLYQGKYNENTQYTLRVLCRIYDTTKTSGNDLYVSWRYTDGTSTSQSTSANGNSWDEIRILSSAGKTIDGIRISYGSSARWLFDKNSFNIIMGDTTLYTLHQEQSLPLTLGSLEYCKIGDYKDEFMKPTGHKNLFNKYNYYDMYSNYDYLSEGYRCRYISLEPNTTYTVSFTASATSSVILLMNRTSNVNGAGYLDFRKTTDTRTYTTDSTGNLYIGAIYAGSDEEIVARLSECDIQIEIGDRQTNFEPYNNGKWYLKKNIGKVVLNGNEEGWDQISGNAPYRYRNSDFPEFTASEMLLCNYYPCKQWDDSWSSFSYLVVATRSSSSIQFRNIDIQDLNDFKDWLLTHNTAVYYRLATPTYTLLNDTLQEQLDNIKNALSYDEQTNISQTNDDLPFVMKATAIREANGIYNYITE